MFIVGIYVLRSIFGKHVCNIAFQLSNLVTLITLECSRSLLLSSFVIDWLIEYCNVHNQTVRFCSLIYTYSAAKCVQFTVFVTMNFVQLTRQHFVTTTFKERCYNVLIFQIQVHCILNSIWILASQYMHHSSIPVAIIYWLYFVIK